VGKGQRKGFTEPMRAASNEGERLRHEWDCKRKNRFKSIAYNLEKESLIKP